MAKLLTQLLDAPIEAPFALIESGKISETRVHETGPQVAPKAAIYTQIKAENSLVMTRRQQMMRLTDSRPSSGDVMRPVVSE